MAFAVVYLIEPKKHIVVAENNIFERNDIKLKNYGVNQNQTHKIFWSESGETPNFDTVESMEFPPNGGNGCYKGRVLKFFETMEQAENYKLSRRPNLPPVYNEERPNEQPIPNCEFNSNSADLSAHRTDEMRSTVTDTDSDTAESTISLAGIFDNSSDGEISVSNAEILIPLASLDVQFAEENDPLAEDVKPIIEFVKMNEEDADAIDNIFNVENIFGTNNDEETVEDGQGEKPNEGINWEPVGDNDEIYIAPCLEMPKPTISHVDFSVKCNDIVSGKMLFATADDGDRAYIANYDGKMKAINISARVINGLKVLNGGLFKKSLSVDRRFIKALLVCCIGQANIAAGILDPIVVAFIKELFALRAEGDEDRLATFDELLQTCCREMKKSI